MFDIATTRTFHAQPRNHQRQQGWIWPLPRLGEHDPIIRRIRNGSCRHALIAYANQESVQRYVPVFAVHEGVITFAGRTMKTIGESTLARYSMCLDHPGGWSTRYSDLEHIFSLPVDRFSQRRKQRVRAGDVLGYATRSPLCLPFELWRSDDESYESIDPGEHMRDWRVLPWNETPNAGEAVLAKQAA